MPLIVVSVVSEGLWWLLDWVVGGVCMRWDSSVDGRWDCDKGVGCERREKRCAKLRFWLDSPGDVLRSRSWLRDLRCSAISDVLVAALTDLADITELRQLMISRFGGFRDSPLKVMDFRYMDDLSEFFPVVVTEPLLLSILREKLAVSQDPSLRFWNAQSCLNTLISPV